MFERVLVYQSTGEFVGYGIKSANTDKLQSTNLWTEEELPALHKRLEGLNRAKRINAHWPDARDPDVLVYTENPEWEPIEMTRHQVIDEDNSYLVWVKVAVLDDKGEPNGEEEDGPELDEEASVIKYKTVKAPTRQSDVGTRVRKAQELVAKARAKIPA